MHQTPPALSVVGPQAVSREHVSLFAQFSLHPQMSCLFVCVCYVSVSGCVLDYKKTTNCHDFHKTLFNLKTGQLFHVHVLVYTETRE